LTKKRGRKGGVVKDKSSTNSSLLESFKKGGQTSFIFYKRKRGDTSKAPLIRGGGEIFSASKPPEPDVGGDLPLTRDVQAIANRVGGKKRAWRKLLDQRRRDVQEKKPTRDSRPQN